MEYDFSGDCIGLSPIIFGEEGQYVQSDMQFALQIMAGMRRYQEFEDTLDPTVALSLSSRFFRGEYMNS